MSVALARARCSRHVIFCLTMCNRKQDLVLFFSRVVIPHFMRRQLLCEKITISGGQVCTFYPCTAVELLKPVTQRTYQTLIVEFQVQIITKLQFEMPIVWDQEKSV